jgi:hypothetical protein
MMPPSSPTAWEVGAVGAGRVGMASSVAREKDRLQVVNLLESIWRTSALRAAEEWRSR